MKLHHQCTTKEQSKKLLDLGFEESTASLVWYLVSRLDPHNEDYISSNRINAHLLPYRPCWTVGDMMQLIKESQAMYYNDWASPNGISIFYADDNTPVNKKEFTEHKLWRDNLFEALVWLKEQKYL